MKIEVDTHLTPKQFAALMQISERHARSIFAGETRVRGKIVPTVPVGSLRRMRWSTFEKYFREV